MKKTFIAIMSLSLFATACDTAPQAPTLVSGIAQENFDLNAKPNDDFYQYAAGGWMKNNPLDAEHSRYGTFDKLAEDNREQLKSLIEEIASSQNEKGSIADKIATFYNVGMDSTAADKQGNQPIQPLLQEIASLSSRDDVKNEIAKLHLKGIFPFFAIFSEADYSDSNMQLAWINQSGLGIGDRDYYIKDENKHIREAYMTMAAKDFYLSGYDKISGMSAENLSEKVMAIETRLAKAQYDRLTNRDPYKTFHKMSIEEADAAADGLGFSEYFKKIGLAEVTYFNMAQPEYIQEVGKVLAETDLEDLKAYMALRVIVKAAPYLSQDFVDASFDFYGRELSGKEENQPRWKRVTGVLNGAMSEAIGQMYVQKYFPAEAKQRMTTLVGNLQEAFAQRIRGAAWMDNATKEKALEKLSSILVKVGYPDTWRDYSGLSITSESYYANVISSNIFDMQYMLGKIDKPTDRYEWQMPPQMVNAYYNPTTNEICFPAAILQPPFFDMNADDAVNYGGIGVVIGHEMTHGFDDQGRQYDKDGNLNDWWLESDAENFKNNAKVLSDYFSKIKVLDEPETYANGELTLGENIADNGGLHISYLAMQNAIAKGQINKDKMDGFTPEQRFFLSYARVWASNVRDKEIVRLTTQDVHSLARWRVNGTLPHVAEFVEAWNIQPGDKMWLNPDERVTLW